MTGATPIPTVRPAVTSLRTATEGVAILTPLAVLIGWLVTLLPIEIPMHVQTAIVALVVALGNTVLSMLRDRKSLKPAAVSIVVLAVFGLGCVTWNGGDYNAIASTQIFSLRSTPDTEAINETECEAFEAGAAALRDEAGGSKSIRAPLFTGRHLERVSASHEHLALICYQLVKRELIEPIEPGLRSRNRTAWAATWQNGRSLYGEGN